MKVHSKMFSSAKLEQLASYLVPVVYQVPGEYQYQGPAGYVGSFGSRIVNPYFMHHIRSEF